MTGQARSIPRVSIAMCTYQGEVYLQEQLDSIAKQTRLPDELVVCDDGSTDGTVAILEKFSSKGFFPVRVHLNQERLGPTKNFERAVTYCDGDTIFLSDQDDVWHPEKLEVLTAALAQSPDVGAIFSNADVVGPGMRSEGYSIWDAVAFTPALQRKFARGGAMDVLLKRNVVGGMTLGFRSTFRDLIVPMPGDWFHDCWIPLLIAAAGEVALVAQPLLKYRQHPRQSIGLQRARIGERMVEKRKVRRTDLLQLADHYAAAHERLMAQRETFPSSSETLHRLEGKVRHIRARADMKSGNRRLRLLAREIFARNYQRFSSGWRSVAVDVFLS